ncbi:MAG: hypothetical protein M1816_003051 [Peltula sp. TS41687]|nr:MAG: hypothetical protein M1816_003051 [Peltula sp. TS41687]
MSSIMKQTHGQAAPTVAIEKHLTFANEGRYAFKLGTHERFRYHVGLPGKYSFEALSSVQPGKVAFRMTANVKPSIESRQLLESRLAMKVRAARREEATAQKGPGQASKVTKNRAPRKAAKKPGADYTPVEPWGSPRMKKGKLEMFLLEDPTWTPSRLRN